MALCLLNTLLVLPLNYVINKVPYDDCHALRLFFNALISVVSVISHSVYTLVLSVVVLSNSRRSFSQVVLLN